MARTHDDAVERARQSLKKWQKREYHHGEKCAKWQRAHMELWDSLYYLLKSHSPLEKENQVLREALSDLYYLCDAFLVETEGLHNHHASGHIAWDKTQLKELVDNAKQALAEADKMGEE